MPSAVNFFDAAEHKLSKLRKKYNSSPRVAAFLFGLWMLKNAAGGNLLGDTVLVSSKNSDTPLGMAALVRGGIGDALLSLAFLHGLAVYAGVPVFIDVYSSSPPEAVRSLCYGHKVFRQISSLKHRLINEYDLIVDITRMAWFPGVNARKIAALSPPLLKFIEDTNKFRKKNHAFFIDEGQRLSMDYANVLGAFRQCQMDMQNILCLKEQPFSLVCEENIAETVKTFGLSEGYITLHRESGDEGKNSLKLWSETKYRSLITNLREQYPQRNIVLLGCMKDGNFPGVVDLRGETSFPQLKALLKGAALHIGCEGIMPHLRHFLHGGPSIVLFGPTSCRHYGYGENANLSGTLCPQGCEWLSRDWQGTCIRGFYHCRSLEEISVSHVMDKVSASFFLHSSTGNKS